MAFKNGQATPAQLAKTKTGHTLAGTAAKSYDRLNTAFTKQFGYALKLTQGYRPRTEQEKIFLQRYEKRATGSGPYGDVRWYSGARYVRVRGAAAAIPGTSNHGLGVAIDINTGIGFGSFTSAQYKWLAKNGPAYGWTNVEGRAVNEPWHWVYKESTDSKRGTVYVVKAGPLRVRAKASTTSKVKHLRKVGYKARFVSTVKANGYLWGKTRYGNFYAIQSLDGKQTFMEKN